MHEKNGRPSQPGFSWSTGIVLLVLLGGSAIGLTHLGQIGDSHAAISIGSGAPEHGPSPVAANVRPSVQGSATQHPSAPSLRLQGIAIWRANDPTAARALHDGGGGSAVFAVGDSVAGGFRLERIEAHRVVIEATDGRRFAIPLQSAATVAAVPLVLESSAGLPVRTVTTAGPGTPVAVIDESRAEPAPESNSD